MMKKTTAILLSAILLLSSVSCGNGKNGDETTTAAVTAGQTRTDDTAGETGAPDTEETTAWEPSLSDTPLTVVKDGKSDYKIVRIGNQLTVADAAAALRDAVKKKTGCELPIVTDREGSTDAHEIVIGLSTVKNGNDGIDRTGLNENGYFLSADGNTILLTAATAKGVQRAALDFTYRYVTAEGVTVPGDLYHVVKKENGIRKLTISGHDISEFVIECDMSASYSVNHAAAELVHYIEEACGVTPEIVASAGDHCAIRLDSSYDGNEESFSIKTYDKGIVICGSPVRGLLYGVYRFLEDYIGWNFLPYDTDVLMAEETVTLENIDDSYTPYFEFRAPFWTPFSVNRYATKRLVNSNIRAYPDDETLGGYYGFTGNYVHTFAEMLGISPNTQPCLSDEKTYEKLLAAVLAILAEHPDADIISVSQNDTPTFCTCDGCTGKKLGGNTTDALLLLINRVAEAVEKDYPDVKIHTLAYNVTRTPPKVIKPRDNVIVQLCTIECCFNHALNDETCERNVALRKDIEAWSEICKNLYVWDYTTNYRFYLAPFPNFDILSANIRFFHEHNVVGLFAQGNEFNLWGEFGELRSYLIAELMLDPYMTEEEYDAKMNRFLAGYYGEGWKHIRAYIDFLTESSNKKSHFGIYATPDGMFDAQDFIKNRDQIDKWFTDAAAEASDVTSVGHIRLARLSASYLKWYFNFDDVLKNGTKEELEEAKKACAALFDDIAAEQIRLMDVRAPLGEYYNAVKRNGSPRNWDPLADTVNIPDNGFTD